MTERFRPSAAALFYTAALLFILVQFGSGIYTYVQVARQALDFPFPLDYGEGPLLDQALRLAQGEEIYRRSITTPPFTISNYPPLYIALQAPLVNAFGPAFWYGRAVSILSALAAAILAGLTLHSLSKDWIAAAITTLTLLCFPYLAFWSLFNRVDTLGLALSWAGIYCMVRWQDRPFSPWLAGALLAAAIFTKQTFALAAPFTLFIWLLSRRRWKPAFILAGVVSLLSLLLFAALNALTGGGFYFNTVTANANPYTITRFVGFLSEIFVNGYYFLLSGFIFFAAERLGNRTRYWFFCLVYLTAGFFSASLSGKDGSSVNDLLELAAGLALVSGAVIAWGGKNYWLKGAMVILLAVQIGALLQWTRSTYLPLIETKTGDRQRVEELAEVVRSTPGAVLADEYMGLLPLAGKRIVYQPFEFKMLNEVGLWDERLIIQAIQQKEFGAILLFEPSWGPPLVVGRWSPQVRSAIWANYRLSLSTAYTWVYIPKE